MTRSTIPRRRLQRGNMTSTYIESDKSPWEVSKSTPNLHVIIVTSEEAKKTCSGVLAQLRTDRSHVDRRCHVNTLVIQILALMRLTRLMINSPSQIRTVTFFTFFINIATSVCPLSSRSPRSTWSRAVFQVIWTVVIVTDRLFPMVSAPIDYR